MRRLNCCMDEQHKRKEIEGGVKRKHSDVCMCSCLPALHASATGVVEHTDGALIAMCGAALIKWHQARRMEHMERP